MEYTWLLGVGLLMAAWQAFWWIVNAYLLIGFALFLKWDKEDGRQSPRPRWWELVILAVIVALLWPIVILTRRVC